MNVPIMDIRCEAQYDAAHWLPNVAPGHKCGNLHGHTYRLEVVVRGTVDGHTGWVTDFADVKAVVGPLVGRLDHHNLNDLIPNPTVENVLLWLWERLECELPGLHELTLHEGATSSATFRGRATA